MNIQNLREGIENSKKMLQSDISESAKAAYRENIEIYQASIKKLERKHK